MPPARSPSVACGADASTGSGAAVARDPGRRVLGVDLGGTKIASGVVDAAGRLSGLQIQPTPAAEGPEAVLEALLQVAEASLAAARIAWSDIHAVGVAAPGPVDLVQGRVVAPPNLVGWDDVPLGQWLRERTGHLVVLDNDANAAGLAEARFGAGQDCSPLLYLTVSTGIGGAILLGGSLLRGAAGAAGEVGHIAVVPEGPRCGCGSQGCLEAVASGSAISREARQALATGRPSRLRSLCGEDIDTLSATHVAQAAAEGDALAREVLDVALGYLGLGVAGLVNVLNPACVVVGGGLTGLGEPLLEAIRAGIRAHANPVAARSVTVRRAALGAQVGVLGAAALALDAEPSTASGSVVAPPKLAP